MDDAIVDRVQRRVLDGMGLIVLHSGHYSKIFRRLMGTSCDLKWREAGERERLWVVDPSHPIAEGLGESFVLEHEEMYGEHFDIPAPDQLVFVSWFQGGEVFRSGCCYQRGRGPDLLLPARPRDAPDLLQPGRPAGDRQRGAVGIAAGRARCRRSATGSRWSRSADGSRQAEARRRISAVMAGTTACRSPITA